MTEYSDLDRGNDVLGAVSGDATSPVYSDGIREFRLEDGHVKDDGHPTWYNSLAFLVAAIAFAIATLVIG
ncbi:MAG: hypothetical protein V2I43_24150 [Parvularcula sp.]|jgi:hypothetical protein|nr:hypothetical protein [Parvularcula sp.]